jgi:hypothetical protein
LASRSNGSPAADKAFNRSSPSKNPGCPAILDPPHPPSQKQAIRDQKQPVFRGVQLADGLFDAAPDRLAAAIGLRGKLVGCAALSSKALSL